MKEFLTRSSSKGTPGLGKPRLVSFLSDSHHSSARILTVNVRDVDDEVFVLKQVKTLRNPIFGKYLLKDGETCPEYLAGQCKSRILEITDEDPKKLEKYEKQKLEKQSSIKVDGVPSVIKVSRRDQKILDKLKNSAPVGYSHVFLPLEFCSKKLETFSDGADTLMESTEFLVEATVDYLVKTHMKDKANFFLTSSATWRSKRHGNILLKNAGFDINFHFSFFSALQVQAIVLQAMYAIAWAQKYIHLKHHDLHCGNVFIDGKIEQTTQLKFPEGKTFSLPAKMPKILIADYGLSSATDPSSKSRVTRADFHLMETQSGSTSASGHSSDVHMKKKCSHSGPCESRSSRSTSNTTGTSRSTSTSASRSENSKSSGSSESTRSSEADEESSSIEISQSLLETGSVSSENSEDEMDEEEEEEQDNDWGVWTHELNPENSKRHLGYDIACFVSNLQEEAEEKRHESLPWLNSVLSVMKKLDPEFFLTRRGRPLTTTCFSIEDLAKQMNFSPVFFHESKKKKSN
jgi:hypothetical protein